MQVALFTINVEINKLSRDILISRDAPVFFHPKPALDFRRLYVQRAAALISFIRSSWIYLHFHRLFFYFKVAHFCLKKKKKKKEGRTEENPICALILCPNMFSSGCKQDSLACVSPLPSWQQQLHTHTHTPPRLQALVSHVAHVPNPSLQKLTERMLSDVCSSIRHVCFTALKATGEWLTLWK